MKRNGKEIWFVDCPGFSDNEVDKEFPNRAAVQQIIRNARTVRILFIMNYNEMICRKGQYVLEAITTMSRLFKEEGLKKKVIIPLVN